MDELIDLVSFNDRVLGTVEKERAHREGLLHRAVHLWILREGADGASLLLQKRGDRKTLMPGRLDVSAAGHLLAGESPLCGMLRECREELGFTPLARDLTCLGRRVELFEDGEIRNHEITTVYLMRDDRPLAAYPIGYPEVSAVCEVSLRALSRLFAGECEELTAPACLCDGEGASRRGTLSVRRDGFVPRIDAYVEKICCLAAAYLRGERLLYI